MFISVLTLVFGFTFYQNSVYQDELDMGYDKKGLLMVDLANGNEAKRFKASIESNPMIENVSLTNNHIGWGSYSRSAKSGEMEHEVYIFDIGYNYLETMGLKVIAGRTFDLSNKQKDKENAILINEKFASQFGWTDPIGQRITIEDTLNLRIVGMVEDFYTWGFWSNIGPTMFRLKDDQDLSVVVARVPNHQIASAREYMKDTWVSLIPNRPTDVSMHEEDVLGEAKDVNVQYLTDVPLFGSDCCSFISYRSLHFGVDQYSK